MARLSRRQFVGGLVSATALPPLLTGCRGGSEQPAAPPSGGSSSSAAPLRIIWAKWDPASYLQVLSDDYKKKYGRELTTPKTWAELRDLAEFFTRPKNQPKPLYGVTVFYSREYDAVTMGYQPLLWGWGGSWGDEKMYQVEGVLNTKPAY